MLFKYKLVELSPLPLQPQAIPSLLISHKGKGTVNVREIENRFNHFGIQVNWKRITKIQKYRNNIEHYFDARCYDDNELKHMILDIFLVINKFISNYLNHEAFDLFDDIKNGYNQFVEQFIDEKYGSEVHLAIKDGGDLPVSYCPNCHEQTFLYEEEFCIYCSNQIATYECQSCQGLIAPEDMESFPLCGYCNYKWHKVQDE